MSISALVDQLESAKSVGKSANIPLEVILESVSPVITPQLPGLQVRFTTENNTDALIYILATLEFYDDSIEALNNLLSSLPRNRRDVMAIDFQNFYLEQKSAYERRSASGTPHNPDFLQNCFGDSQELYKRSKYFYR